MPFNTPSRESGISEEKEMLFRQLAASFIEVLGKNITSYLSINTATVFMHRFYMLHSFKMFSWETIVAPALFLASKVEDHPCRLKLLIAKLNDCLHGKQPEDITADINECIMMENLLLQTLGFDLHVTQPHTIIIRCYENIKIPRHISKAAYFLATYSLQLTVMCLEYNPTTVACFCIHLASKWSDYQIPNTTEGQEWYYVVDKTISAALLDNLTMDFEDKMNKCPPILKENIAIVFNNCKRSIDSKENIKYASSAQEISHQLTPIVTNETCVQVKRAHSSESTIEQLCDTGVDNKTQSGMNDSNEPLPKIYRTIHSKDSRTVQLGFPKLVYPKDPCIVIPQTAIPKDPQKVLPTATPRDLPNVISRDLSNDRPTEDP